MTNKSALQEFIEKYERKLERMKSPVSSEFINPPDMVLELARAIQADMNELERQRTAELLSHVPTPRADMEAIKKEGE